MRSQIYPNGVTAQIYFVNMVLLIYLAGIMAALKYKPTKLDERVLENVKVDVTSGKYPSDNFAINSILKKHYKIKDGEKKDDGGKTSMAKEGLPG